MITNGRCLYYLVLGGITIYVKGKVSKYLEIYKYHWSIILMSDGTMYMAIPIIAILTGNIFERFFIDTQYCEGGDDDSSKNEGSIKNKMKGAVKIIQQRDRIRNRREDKNKNLTELKILRKKDTK